MKIITISKIGYNAPSQANWSYGIWKLDTINTENDYCMSYTLREAFGGDSRIRARVRADLKYEIIETKGTYTSTGTPKITGVSKMLDMESEEVYQIIREFLTNN
jgi:hypothetical protein